jgi:arabinose-5-phosphate isomerase
LATAVIQTEIEAIQKLLGRINDDFIRACEIILACKGRVVVTGMGKSGHIAGKIAATLASTGTPAFFVHPGEASHGDLGMITVQDVVIAISNSGETQEVSNILPIIKLLHVPLISMTGNAHSTLARYATVNINTSVDKEACPLNLTPSASTTAALVMGDALAISLLELKGFNKEDFAKSHPGGSLGKRLLVRVGDLMHTGHKIPVIKQSDTIKAALIEMTNKGFGSTFVVDDNNILVGIYTDGDVRRTLDKNIDIHTTPVHHVMGKKFLTTEPDTLAAEALRIMEDHKITMLGIVTKDNHPSGLIHMHDILRSGLL